MEKQAGFWLQTVLLLAVLGSTLSEEKVLKVGDQLDLRPPKSGPFTNVLWKHNGNLVAEWTQGGGDVDYFGSFKGRATLDATTGQLTISDVKETDSGVYTVELSNTVQDVRYNVKVIKELPKPQIWVQPVSCSRDSTECTLTCGPTTEGAEPVTYSWRKDDGEWKVSEKILPITKAEDKDVQKFTCRMTNPVSKDESDRLDNPLYVPPNPVPIVVGVLVPLIVLVAVGVGIWKRNDIKNLFTGETQGYETASTGAKENELHTVASTASAPADPAGQPETAPSALSAPPAAADESKLATGPSTDPENGNATYANT